MKTLYSLSSLALASVLTLTGCGTSANQGGAPAAPSAAASTAGGEVNGGDIEGGHSRDGWWCAEHGVPEEICAQCSTKLAAQFKAKSDWCQEHDRPESQCFVCNPDLEQKFAAQYEAKYGKKPPHPEADEAAHGHDHDHGA
ncbi:MAG TPA: RND transporter [Pirellulales bacterium]|nr:RND transporter [Pirellulales bacterium]